MSILLLLTATAGACVETLDLDTPLAPPANHDPSDTGTTADTVDGLQVDATLTLYDVSGENAPVLVQHGLGYPCDDDLACQSGHCVTVFTRPGGSVCSRPCGDDCPRGFSCSPVEDTQVCVPDDLCVDADRDGYGLGPGCVDADCDDLNATVNPGYPERCNGIDNDCSGVADDPLAATSCVADAPGVCALGTTTCQDGVELCVPGPAAVERCNALDDDCDGVVDEDADDATRYYADDDHDGHGAATDSGVTACEPPMDHVTASDDCDDADPTAYPGAAERCDGVDNDCDGDIDDNVISIPFYPDADGDGYGDASVSPTIGCSAPVGFSALDGDCDDGDASISPAAEETPGDGVDSNCDGNEACHVDRDQDGYYARTPTLVSGVTCVGELIASPTALPGDCDDTDPDVYPGQVERCDGRDTDCDDRIDDACSCDTGEQICRGLCLSDATCCDDTDCGEPLFCPSSGATCVCPGDQQVCGDACIAPDGCCTDADCDRAMGYVCDAHQCRGHIDLDFEDLSVGALPPYGHTRSATTAWLAVVAGDGADDSNGLCLHDERGTSPWAPSWFVDHVHESGQYVLEFDVRMQSQAAVKLVWRDLDGGGFVTGPVLVLTTGGVSNAPAQGHQDVAPDVWHHGRVTIDLDRRPVTWWYALTASDDTTVHRGGGDVVTDFRAIESWGILPYEPHAATTCFDNIVTLR